MWTVAAEPVDGPDSAALLRDCSAELPPPPGPHGPYQDHWFEKRLT